MRISNTERLRRFYARFSGEDHVLIPINADPDAIACAMAVKRLLWRKTASVAIAAVNEIQRPDNLAMVRLIGVTMVPFQQIDPLRFTKIIMVDSQPDHHPDLAGLAPDVIIDHHPVGGRAKADYTDIRPKYGATATILIEYLRTAKIKPSVKLATGLYYAIKTDTSNFERQTLMEDLNAFQFIFRYCNTALARRIESAEMRLDYLVYFERALRRRCLRKGRVFVHLGEVIHPDVCVQIADFFMRIEAVNWSVVSGVNDDKLIVIFRNDGMRKNAGKIAKKAFGRIGSAGGHKSAARAEIPLEALDSSVHIALRAETARWIVRQVERCAGNPRTGLTFDKH